MRQHAQFGSQVSFLLSLCWTQNIIDIKLYGTHTTFLSFHFQWDYVRYFCRPFNIGHLYIVPLFCINIAEHKETDLLFLLAFLSFLVCSFYLFSNFFHLDHMTCSGCFWLHSFWHLHNIYQSFIAQRIIFGSQVLCMKCLLRKRRSTDGFCL